MYQNIGTAEDVDDENDYQLSVNGECAKNCKQCAVEIKIKKNYALLGNKEDELDLTCILEMS